MRSYKAYGRTSGEPVWHEDQYIPIERNGRLEDVWWTYGYSPVYDDDGSIGGTLVVCQETTGRMLAERARASMHAETERMEHRAERVLDRVADEHLTMDAEFHILTMNRAAERALGVPRETMVGRTYWEAFPASSGSAIETVYRRVMETRLEGLTPQTWVRLRPLLEIDAYPIDEGGLALSRARSRIASRAARAE